MFRKKVFFLSFRKPFEGSRHDQSEGSISSCLRRGPRGCLGIECCIGGEAVEASPPKH